MQLPGWHDYHPALNSFNRPREPSHSSIDCGGFSWGRIFSMDASRESEGEAVCAGHGDRSLMNIVPKQETLSHFLWHTTKKNETSNIKRLVSN